MVRAPMRNFGGWADKHDVKQVRAVWSSAENIASRSPKINKINSKGHLCALGSPDA